MSLVEITPEMAGTLLSRVVARVFIQDWNADLLLKLDDGSILAFWAASDGPEHWTLDPAQDRSREERIQAQIDEAPEPEVGMPRPRRGT